MKIKTSELSGIALDWAVAKCEGWEYKNYLHCDVMAKGRSTQRHNNFSFSSNWSQGGPIIEGEGITVEYSPWDKEWASILPEEDIRGGWNYLFIRGKTPLIAAMRCYVAYKLGEEAEIPDSLVEEV